MHSERMYRMTLRRVGLLLMAMLIATSLYAYPRTVLLEDLTSSTCAPCATFHGWFDDYADNLGLENMIPIDYHMYWPAPGDDPWYHANPNDNDARRQYYGVTFVPDAYIDGTDCEQSQASINTLYEEHIAVESPIWLTMSQTMSEDGDSLLVTVRAVANEAINGDWHLRIALVEIYEPWQPAAPNGMTEFHNAFVGWANGHDGFDFDHTGDTGDTLTFSTGIARRDSGLQPYFPHNAAFVAFVQNDGDQEVVQAKYGKFADLGKPIGGETWLIGRDESILWDAEAFGDNVMIELNRDYPDGEWTTIVESVENTGETSWTVTEPASSSARMRISTVGNPDESASSYVDFTITPPAVVAVDANPTGTAPSGSITAGELTLDNSSDVDFTGILSFDTGFDGMVASEAEYIYDLPGNTEYGPIGDDVLGGPYTFPFDFDFYGDTVNTIYVGTNGFVSFDVINPNNTYGNTALPGLDNIRAVMPFWDDLLTGNGNIEVTTAEDESWVAVKYNGVGRYGDAAAELWFSVIFRNDNTIDFLYGAMTGTTNSATIGVQNDGELFTQMAFNEEYTPLFTAHTLELSHRWAYSSTTEVTIPAGGSVPVPIVWDATFYSEDDVLTGNWTLSGNTVPEHYTFPLELTVTEALSVGEVSGLPFEFSLGNAYPNPFNPSTIVPFTLASNAFVSMKLYDVMGREVKTLVSKRMSAGAYRQTIQLGDMPTGMYFLKMDVPHHFSAVRKMVLVK